MATLCVAVGTAGPVLGADVGRDSVTPSDARETDVADAAEALVEHERRIGVRLRATGSAVTTLRLAEGVNAAAKRKLAARTLERLRGDDGTVVRNACLHGLDGRGRVPMDGGLGDPRASACVGGDLRAAGAASTSVARDLGSHAGRSRLWLVAPVVDPERGTIAVLSADIDPEALLSQVLEPRSDFEGVAIVDLASLEVLASSARTDEAITTDLIKAVIPKARAGIAEPAPAAPDIQLTPLWTLEDGRELGLLALLPPLAAPVTEPVEPPEPVLAPPVSDGGLEEPVTADGDVVDTTVTAASAVSEDTVTAASAASEDSGTAASAASEDSGTAESAANTDSLAAEGDGIEDTVVAATTDIEDPVTEQSGVIEEPGAAVSDGIADSVVAATTAVEDTAAAVSGVMEKPVAAEGGGIEGILVALSGGILILAAAALLGLLVRRMRSKQAARARIVALYRDAASGPAIDGLTGLPSRPQFDEAIAKHTESYFDTGQQYSLAILDIDDLAAVNDFEDHSAGDEVIIGAAETLQQLTRPEDEVFRIDGDEFAVIMPGYDAERAIDMLERVLHVFRRPPSGIRPGSFSAGVSSVPRYSSDRDIVERQARAALAWVKGHGRNAVEEYDADRDDVPDQPHDRASHAVREVVAGKLLSPVFQPIVDLRSGRILGFEGLVRPDPSGPLPTTAHLFAAASASGRTVELDLACLDVVLAGARDIGPDRILTLNVSPRTLEVKHFEASWLLEGLMRNGIAPHRVIVELTEREAIGDLRKLQQTFQSLQDYGLRIAADDVGAGNSGLRLLSQVRFDIVKIDLALVQEGTEQLHTRKVLESLRDLATNQDAKIVAEGVETPEQLRVIRDMDIVAAQGFLLGRPDRSVAATHVDLPSLAPGEMARAVEVGDRLAAVAASRPAAPSAGPAASSADPAASSADPAAPSAAAFGVGAASAAHGG